MTFFNLFNLPVKGAHLIEAGAGTGKTYTLAGLYLRLVVEQGISVEQILVVTYTKAATEELKTRIRQRLLTAKKCWVQARPDDPLVEALHQQDISSKTALQRIQDALANFDCAAIYTIHGFCQRLLQYYAFETGHLFQSELVQDDTAYVQETAEDFWRRYIATAPKELAAEALKKLRGPDRLTNLLQFCRFPNIALAPDDKKPPLSAILPWRDSAQTLQQQWPRVRDTVNELLQYDGLNGRTYGACKKKKNDRGPTPRQIKVAELCRAMDQWPGDYPLFKQFELLTSHKIGLATNKGKTAPEHPFFDLCTDALKRHERLEEQLNAYLRYLKVRLFQMAGPLMAQKKEQHNVLFFDDLLILVHRAVTGLHGTMLADAIRSQYRAALVDEFQDTDQMQYEIFFKLFATKSNLLTMIGDPKQAIYSFRGADIFSYLQASRAAQSRATLTKNYRAVPDLIKALNTLFGRHPKPFGFSQIGFEDAVAAQEVSSGSSPAMRLWYLPADEKASSKGWVNSGDAVGQIAQSVAQEIVALLNNASSPGFAPEDIAVLVRTHQQAHIIKQALSHRKIPAVLHSAGRVFNTPQAEALERVLLAVATPSDPFLVRAALAGVMFGWDAPLFAGSLEDGAKQWQFLWDYFWTYQQMWHHRGFFAMFRHLMMREGIKKRVLGYPDGERQLTNLLHLAELLHQAETAHGFGPEGLLKWLAFKRRSEEMGGDEQQLRLESDALAVRIITMHKSKGLQFKVVFCPYTWAGLRNNDEAVLLHDPGRKGRLTLALGPMISDAFMDQSRKEVLAENLRMLYVALTRARQRCYWVWGRIKGAEISAPAYLLHGQKIDLDEQQWERQLKETMVGMEYAQWAQSLKALERLSGGTIGVSTLPKKDERSYMPKEARTTSLACHTPKRRLEHNWRIASFSSLTAGQSTHGEVSTWSASGSGTQASGMDANVGLTLFDFPKGARAGLFFHDLLENWDHTVSDKQLNYALVSEKLRQHSYGPEWENVVCQMLMVLSQTCLTNSKESFALGRVANALRINEMAFYFRLKRIKSSQIQAVFQQYAGRSVKTDLTDAMRRINFSPVQGFMKGYIDTVFCHKERYFLVDWKSNYLGAEYNDYLPVHLNRAMAESNYFFQYHLYILALDQLLRRRLKDYDYHKHFGGVFYIFLRGLDQNPDNPSGIFYDRPDFQLVEELNRLMIATP